jgi:hypothetical protein
MKLALVLMLLAVAPMHAQVKPQAGIDVKLTDGTHTWKQALTVPHTTADKSYWISTAISAGLTVLDVENSIYALKSQPGTVEANGIFGNHPSRTRYYSITLPIFAANAYVSWKYKREDDALKAAGIPGHKYVSWKVPNGINSGMHLVGFLVTLLSTPK